MFLMSKLFCFPLLYFNRAARTNRLCAWAVCSACFPFAFVSLLYISHLTWSNHHFVMISRWYRIQNPRLRWYLERGKFFVFVTGNFDVDDMNFCLPWSSIGVLSYIVCVWLNVNWDLWWEIQWNPEQLYSDKLPGITPAIYGVKFGLIYLQTHLPLNVIHWWSAEEYPWPSIHAYTALWLLVPALFDLCRYWPALSGTWQFSITVIGEPWIIRPPILHPLFLAEPEVAYEWKIHKTLSYGQLYWWATITHP